jgi:nicotinamidase-related amidase
VYPSGRCHPESAELSMGMPDGARQMAIAAGAQLGEAEIRHPLAAKQRLFAQFDQPVSLISREGVREP